MTAPGSYLAIKLTGCSQWPQRAKAGAVQSSPDLSAGDSGPACLETCCEFNPSLRACHTTWQLPKWANGATQAGKRVPEPKDSRGLSSVLATTGRVGPGLF